MKELKRARRIRDKQRMKAKAIRVRPWDKQGRTADHLKVCSCWMCGNRRPLYGCTRQERRQADDASARP